MLQNLRENKKKKRRGKGEEEEEEGKERDETARREIKRISHNSSHFIVELRVRDS